MLHFGSQILKEFNIVRGIRRAISSTEEFSRVTVKSKSEGRKFRRFKGVDTRASYMVAYVEATASFRSKISKENIGENRIGVTVSSLGQLDLGEEKKMRFRGGEVVFHRLKTRSKTTNVAEIDVEKVRGSMKTLRVAMLEIECRT